MPKTILHLGSNIGLRNQHLQDARALLAQHLGRERKVSACYETSAWGLENQRDFLNQAVTFKTKRSPEEVLAIALEVENQLGRQRVQKWGERLIDIDVISYGKKIIDTENLIIPHPWMHERRFVLVPVAEIAPKKKHPMLRKRVRDLLEDCTDQGWVRRVNGKFDQ